MLNCVVLNWQYPSNPAITSNAATGTMAIIRIIEAVKIRAQEAAWAAREADMREAKERKRAADARPLQQLTTWSNEHV